MRKKRATRAIFATVLGLNVLPSLAQDTPSQPQPTVIARVGDIEISGVDIAIAAEQSFEQIMQLDEAQRSAFLLQTVIDMTLMAEAARDEGLDTDPLLHRRVAFAEAQLLQRAYVGNGGQIRSVHHVETILVNDEGRATGVRLRDGREWRLP